MTATHIVLNVSKKKKSQIGIHATHDPADLSGQCRHIESLGTTLSKVMIGSLGLLVYVFSSLNHLALPNGMFLDIVLGILCVYTVQTSQLDHV